METESCCKPEFVNNCSMLYSRLPSAVQCRLPRLPSLRPFTTPPPSYTTPTSSLSGLGIASPSSETSCSNSGSSTPNGEYGNELTLRVFNPSSGEVLQQSLQTSIADSRPGRDRPAEIGGDIEWKYAHQGLNLLNLAANESSSIQSQSANAGFARQLYLHALTYLLRGLPQDLTIEEQLSIRGSLPSNIVEPLHVQVNNPNGSGTTVYTERSLLHRILASSIVQLFVFFQFILPYFTYFLTTAYEFDREHKIIQRSFAQGMETLDRFGKSSLYLGSVVLEMGDGKVGQVVGDVTKWVVDGVTGGIQEGVGEVVMIVGTSKAQSLMKK